MEPGVVAKRMKAAAKKLHKRMSGDKRFGEIADCVVRVESLIAEIRGEALAEVREQKKAVQEKKAEAKKVPAKKKAPAKD